MAYTKIKPIRVRLDNCIDYAVNKEKISLEAVIDYAMNKDKTEKMLFVTTFNCDEETIFKDMMATKAEWNKFDGVKGYHLMQSFAPGEVTPQQAHEYGKEFASRLLANKYEVVITTHLDRSHLHNHLVFNSVSYMDGKKYRGNFKDYFCDIRGTSDQICRENNISVITPSGKGRHYTEWNADKKGEPTIRGQIRADIDDIIASSFTFKSFLENLKKRGYAVKHSDTRKYTSIKPPHGDKFIRLTEKSLGANYSDDAIRQRLLEQQETGTFKKLTVNQPVQNYRLKGTFSKGKGKKLHGFEALYFRYLYMLGKVKKRQVPRKVSAYLRSEVIKMKNYAKQFDFLSKNKITTTDELDTYKANLQQQISKITDKRKDLYSKRKVVQADDILYQTISEEITDCNIFLRGIRADIRLCEAVEQNTVAMRERLQVISQDILQQKGGTDNEHRGRSIQSDSKSKFTIYGKRG